MLPVEHNDPINARILAVSEDKIAGFVREPFEEIARRSGVGVDLVMARIAAMLRAGTIRRVRQTLLATNLAAGALVAWKVPEEKIDRAFDWMFQRDPFSGHVVIRSTDTVSAGSEYQLWTTLKVPRGFSLQEHCELLTQKVGAEKFRIMPAKGIFTLGVGHVRRKTIEPGEKADEPAKMIRVEVVDLDEHQWNVLLTPASFARDAHGFGRISSGLNSRLSASKTFHWWSSRSTTSTRIIFAGSSAFSPGSIVFRRTCPTPSVKIPFAGMIRNFSAPTFWVSNSQCSCRENPRGTFNVVQSLYSEPALIVSVERMTT